MPRARPRPPPSSQLPCVGQLQSSRVDLPQDTGRGQGRLAQRQTEPALRGDPVEGVSAAALPPLHQLVLCGGASCAEGCERPPRPLYPPVAVSNPRSNCDSPDTSRHGRLLLPAGHAIYDG